MQTLKDRVESALKQRDITRHSGRFLAVDTLIARMILSKKITIEEKDGALRIAYEWVGK